MKKNKKQKKKHFYLEADNIRGATIPSKHHRISRDRASSTTEAFEDGEDRYQFGGLGIVMLSPEGEGSDPFLGSDETDN